VIGGMGLKKRGFRFKKLTGRRVSNQKTHGEEGLESKNSRGEEPEEGFLSKNSRGEEPEEGFDSP